GLMFFVLLLFAALASAISLLELVVATIIDKFGVARIPATIGTGAVIFLFGIPSAKSDLIVIESLGMNFFASLDWVVSNLALPIGGVAIRIFAGWIMPRSLTREQFNSNRDWGHVYTAWLFLIRFVVPVAILVVFLY